MLGTLTARRAVMSTSLDEPSSSQQPEQPAPAPVSGSTLSKDNKATASASSFASSPAAKKVSFHNNSKSGHGKKMTLPVSCCEFCASRPFNVRIMTSSAAGENTNDNNNNMDDKNNNINNIVNVNVNVNNPAAEPEGNQQQPQTPPQTPSKDTNSTAHHAVSTTSNPSHSGGSSNNQDQDSPQPQPQPRQENEPQQELEQQQGQEVPLTPQTPPRNPTRVSDQATPPQTPQLQSSSSSLPQQHVESPAFSSKKLKRFMLDLESRCGGKDCLQDIAYLSSKEIKTGKRLGKGGSASVYDITGFVLLTDGSNKEEASVPQDNANQDELPPQLFFPQLITSSRQVERQAELRHALQEAMAQKQPQRFVVKRLSKGLQIRLLAGDKYARACAINMVLEAQVLRAMADHPNIVQLVGMGHTQEDLFLVLTHLPESMEQRILAWRKQVNLFKKKELQCAKQAASPKWKMLCRSTALEKQQLRAHIELRRVLYERLHVAQDIAAAVSHLNERGIIYRDLKTSNLGFDSEGIVKLFDFGISRFVPCPVEGKGDPEDSFAMSKVGTKMFMAPEIAAMEEYNAKADVYSFGVLLWQLLALSTPTPLFPETREQDAASTTESSHHVLVSPHEEGIRFEFPLCPCWPMYIQSLLRRIIQRNPSSRPTMAEIERKLQPVLDKLLKEIDRQEEMLQDYYFRNQNTGSSGSSSSSSSSSTKKKLLPFLFGRGGYGRQKTFEIDYENEHE